MIDPIEESMQALSEAIHHRDEAKRHCICVGPCALCAKLEEGIDRLRAKFNQACTAYDPSGI